MRCEICTARQNKKKREMQLHPWKEGTHACGTLLLMHENSRFELSFFGIEDARRVQRLELSPVPALVALDVSLEWMLRWVPLVSSSPFVESWL